MGKLSSDTKKVLEHIEPGPSCEVPGCAFDEVLEWWTFPLSEGPKLCREHREALTDWYLAESVSDAFESASDKSEAVLTQLGTRQTTTPDAYISARRMERREAARLRPRIAEWIAMAGQV